MSRIVYCISIILQAALIVAAGPVTAADQSSARDGDNRWIPSISLVVGFSTQKHSGSVDSRTGILDANGEFLALSDIFPGFDDELRPFDSDQQFMNNLEAGGSLELLTPVLFESLLGSYSPRFFVEGEILSVSTQKKWLARENDPSGLQPPDKPVFTGEAILGQGQGTTSDSENVQYGASIGISVPVSIGDWQFAIKPSLRYLYRELHFTGMVIDATRPFPGNGPTTEIYLFADDSLDMHALGPGLEIEVEVGRINSLASSVFVSGGGYRVLSDRGVTMSDVGPGTNDPNTNFVYRGLFKARVDQWIYRANVGFRVKWLGSN